MAKTLTITNTNKASDFALKNWETGLDAAKGKPAVVPAEFPVVAGNGAVKFRFWETEQFETIAAEGTKDIVTDSVAEEAYYMGLDGVAGLKVAEKA